MESFDAVVTTCHEEERYIYIEIERENALPESPLTESNKACSHPVKLAAYW
jgi:hypothetical protein